LPTHWPIRRGLAKIREWHHGIETRLARRRLGRIGESQRCGADVVHCGKLLVITVYGIANCDTVQKARAWLDGRNVSYEFVDFKKTPPSREQVAHWCKVLGENAVMNTRGTTWRKLDPAIRERAATPAGAVAVLVEHPSAIKRPVIEAGTDLLVGFDEQLYAQCLQR
jgi:arsenate reductase